MINIYDYILINGKLTQLISQQPGNKYYDTHDNEGYYEIQKIDTNDNTQNAFILWYIPHDTYNPPQILYSNTNIEIVKNKLIQHLIFGKINNNINLNIKIVTISNN